MYKEDLALNNPPGLICHKTQPTNLLDVYCYIKSFLCVVLD